MFVWLRSFLLVFLLAAHPAAGWAAPAEAVVGDPSRAVRMGRGVEVLVETAGQPLSREQVMSSALSPRWQTVAANTVTLPRQAAPVWLRFDVLNQGSAEGWVVSIDVPTLTGVDFHQWDSGFSRWPASLNFVPGRASDASLPKGPTPSFAFKLRPGERTTLLMRVDGGRPLLLPLLVWEQSAFVDTQRNSILLDALLMGAVCVMFLYNLSLFIFTRDPNYREYTLYLAAIVASNLGLNGFGPMYLWGESPWFMQNGIEVLNCVMSLTSALFFRRFLRLNEAPRHMNWANLAIIASSVFFLVWSFKVDIFGAPHLFEALGVPAVLFSCVAGLYTSYVLAFRGDMLARYVAIAWSALLLAIIHTALALEGSMDASVWTKHMVQIGHVIEATLLSMALAARIRKQQTRALEMARSIEQEREEKLRAQELTLAVQEQAKFDLEQRVVQRTSQLELALKNVEQANVELARLSVTDALTQAHNRRYFDDILHSEYLRSQRTGSHFALLMADIDHFKRINDGFGHVAGDECLRLVARALAEAASRSTDLVARYGGEEFALILPSVDAERAMQVAERARRAVEEITFTVRGERIPLTISIGVRAGTAREGQSVADFLADADAALYAAKREGRNRVRNAQMSSTQV